MDKFVLNLIHRPEMVPEYAENVTGQGKRKISEIKHFDRIFGYLQDTAETGT